MINLDKGVAEVRQASAPSLLRSARVRTVEGHYPEAILLAMAGSDLAARRKIADAVAASVRIRPQVRGRQLIEAGIEPGPWVGRALVQTRDAIVDGEIKADQSAEFALDMARTNREEVSQ